MLNKELIKKLQQLPADMEVFITQENDEYKYNLIETAEVRPIVFGAEDVPRKDWATVNCVVITDK